MNLFPSESSFLAGRLEQKQRWVDAQQQRAKARWVDAQQQRAKARWVDAQQQRAKATKKSNLPGVFLFHIQRRSIPWIKGIELHSTTRRMDEVHKIPLHQCRVF